MPNTPAAAITTIMPEGPRVILLMGVCGSGKSTLGRRLAAALGGPFVDGDALHPPANVEKMARGLPLTDADRAPWLERIRTRLDAALQDDPAAASPLVVTCSALRRAYRDRLGLDRPAIRVIHLTADPAVLRRRLEQRPGHFMKPGMLDSQLETLETPDTATEPFDGEPHAEGHIRRLDVAGPLDQTFAALLRLSV